MKTALVVSPHLDDGVLSLGALMAAYRRQGWDVVILTIFSGGPEGELSAAAIEDRTRYQGQDPLPIRLAEDLNAAHILDVTTAYVGLPELIFRRRPDGRPRCESLDDIFGPLQTVDHDVIAAVTAAVRKFSADEVFVPMGVGKHVDHVIVNEACKSINNVRYYPDVPYALREHLESNAWNVNDDDVALWLDAVNEYVSQPPILFEGIDWRKELGAWLDVRPPN